MSNLKTKELIICLATIIVLALVIATNVFAASPVDSLTEGNSNSNNNSSNGVPEIEDRTQNNNINNINSSSNTNINANNTNVNANNTNTASMPDTGVDYSVVFIVAICGISAIYAYKKIKDYNNI